MTMNIRTDIAPTTASMELDSFETTGKASSRSPDVEIERETLAAVLPEMYVI